MQTRTPSNQMEKRSKVLLFLGSGVSLDSGIPNVKELTERVFDIRPDELKAVHPFCPSYSPLSNEYKHRGAQEFLKIVHEYAVSHGLEDVNYEDLHSLCTKIEKYRFAPRKDPTSRPMVEFVHGRISTTNFYKAQGNNLQICAGTAREFIDYTIKQELLFPKRKPENLDCILEYIERLGPKNCDVITLNHDTLVEQLLANRNDWTDGFNESEIVYYEEASGQRVSQKIDYISEESLMSAAKVRLIKPHGSCNWYNLKRSNDWKWGIPRSGWRETLTDSANQPISENPFDAGLLSGSLTKEWSYIFGPTALMFRNAYRILQEYDRVICSGYGWKDHGINRMLIEWIQQNGEKRIAILESEKSENFPNIQRLSQQWTAGSLSRTIIHPYWLSEADPSTILELLNVGK